jgi:tRNA-splicing ligase RtcB
MGIIPGSMGSETYIVRGKGCAKAFCSAPHGAGRLVPRGQAKERFTAEDVARETRGVACKKDASMLDETKSAYKDIKEVIQHSNELVEVVAELKQFVNLKG